MRWMILVAVLGVANVVGAEEAVPAPAPEAAVTAVPAPASEAAPAPAPAAEPVAPIPVISVPPALERPVRISATAELGSLAVLSHKIQYSRGGTYFDYVKEGGQDVLFPFARFSFDMTIKRHHQVTFLLQPLELQTTRQLDRDVQVDDVNFKAGTIIDHLYSFPFTRGSYLYDFFGDDDRELSIGASLQIRNARIEFGSKDGKELRSQRDIGPVPLLKARGKFRYRNGFFWGFEVDGTYAAIKGVNGSNNEVTGALADVSLRAGLRLAGPAEAFVNLRYIGGGAEGQGDPEPPNDGYTRNWLHFMTLSLGATIDLL
jgi:hypothetical protein